MTESRKSDRISKIVAIPTTWVLYELPANAFEVMGGIVQNPPLIVAESLVESGMGRRIKMIEADIQFSDVPSDDEGEEEEGKGPWYNET